MSTNSRRLRKREGATVATVLDSEQFFDASVGSNTPSTTGSLSRKSLSKLGSLAKAMSARTSLMFQRKPIPFADQELGVLIIQPPLPRIVVTPADPAIYASPPLEMIPLEPASSPMVRSDCPVEILGRYGEFMMTGPAPDADTSYTSPVTSDEGHSSSSAESSGLGTPQSIQSEKPGEPLRESAIVMGSSVSNDKANDSNGKVSIDTLASHEIAVLLNRQTSDPQFSKHYQELRSTTLNNSSIDLVSIPEDGSQDTPLQTVQFSPTIDTVFRIVNQPLMESN